MMDERSGVPDDELHRTVLCCTRRQGHIHEQERQSESHHVVGEEGWRAGVSTHQRREEGMRREGDPPLGLRS